MPKTDLVPFTDSHVHFWDFSQQDVEYAWLQPRVPHQMLGDIEGFKVRRFSVDEFTAQSRFQNVDRVVHVGVSSNPDPVRETGIPQPRILPPGGRRTCGRSNPSPERYS